MGNRHIAINPRMKITADNTPAKIGRRMKKCEKFMQQVAWGEEPTGLGVSRR
jgi:hypothetical protein